MKFINTPFKLQLLLLISSFSIYFFHIHSVILHLNTVLSGYYYKDKTFSAVSCNMIINRECNGQNEWLYNTMLKCFSGFYDGYAVFEDKIKIEKNTKYDFMLKGVTDKTYRISDFMLRHEGLDVMMIKKNNDSVINNFPTH